MHVDEQSGIKMRIIRRSRICRCFIIFWIIIVLSFTISLTPADRRTSFRSYFFGHKSNITAGNLMFVYNYSTHVYEINSKPVIWLYWPVKSEMPVHVRLLAESIKCVNQNDMETIIVYDDNVEEFWPNYPKKYFHKLIPVHRNHLLRVNILKIYGGVYMDVDSYAIQPLRPYYEKLQQYDMIGPNWGFHRPLSFGLLGPARANLPFFEEFSRLQMERLNPWREELMSPFDPDEENPYPISWTELLGDIGVPLITEYLKKKQINCYTYDGFTTVGQLVKRNITSFYFSLAENLDPPLNAIKQTPILYTHPKQIDKKEKQLENTTIDQFLNPEHGDTIFSYFLKCSLRRCFNIKLNPKSNAMTKLTDISINYLIEVSREPAVYVCYRFDKLPIPPKV